MTERKEFDIVEAFKLDSENFIWQDLAMCEGISPFNPNIKDNADIFFEESESNPHVANSAKDICEYCPVKSICFQDAIETKAHGIRGGEMFSGGKVAKQ